MRLLILSICHGFRQNIFKWGLSQLKLPTQLVINNWIVGSLISPVVSVTNPFSVWFCDIILSNGVSAQAVWDVRQTCSNHICTYSNYIIPTRFLQGMFQTTYGVMNSLGRNTSVPVGMLPILLIAPPPPLPPPLPLNPLPQPSAPASPSTPSEELNTPLRLSTFIPTTENETNNSLTSNPSKAPVSTEAPEPPSLLPITMFPSTESPFSDTSTAVGMSAASIAGIIIGIVLPFTLLIVIIILFILKKPLEVL